MTLDSIKFHEFRKGIEQNNNALKESPRDHLKSKRSKSVQINNSWDNLGYISEGFELKLAELKIDDEADDVSSKPEPFKLYNQKNNSANRRKSAGHVEHKIRRGSFEHHRVVNHTKSDSTVLAKAPKGILKKESTHFKADRRLSKQIELHFESDDFEDIFADTEQSTDRSGCRLSRIEEIPEVQDETTPDEEHVLSLERSISEVQDETIPEEEPVSPTESRILGWDLVEFKGIKSGLHEMFVSNKEPLNHGIRQNNRNRRFSLKKPSKQLRRDSLMCQMEYLESRINPSSIKKKKQRRRTSKGHVILAKKPQLQENIDKFKSSELHCYMDLIKHKCKAEHGAFIDMDGKLLLQDWGMGLDKGDAAGVVQVINSFRRTTNSPVSLFKLNLGKREATCFRNSDISFVGMTENHFTYAHKCKDFVVLVLSDPESNGSCIFQMTKFVRYVNNKSKKR